MICLLIPGLITSCTPQNAVLGAVLGAVALREVLGATVELLAAVLGGCLGVVLVAVRDVFIDNERENEVKTVLVCCR